MAAKLNTTVSLADENGKAHTFKAGDEIPAWAEAELAKTWAKDRDDLWTVEETKAKAEAPAKRTASK